MEVKNEVQSVVAYMGHSASKWELGQACQSDTQPTALSIRLYYQFIHVELFHQNSGTPRLITEKSFILISHSEINGLDHNVRVRVLGNFLPLGSQLIGCPNAALPEGSTSEEALTVHNLAIFIILNFLCLYHNFTDTKER